MLVLAFGLSVLWLVAAPWDWSEVNADGHGIGSPVTLTRYFCLLGGAIIINAVVAYRGLQPYRCFTTTLGTVSFWFLWRAGVAKTSGVNFLILAWTWYLLPSATLASLSGARIGGRLAKARGGRSLPSSDRAKPGNRA